MIKKKGNVSSLSVSPLLQRTLLVVPSPCLISSVL
jgi:hypothetical protein